MTRAQWRALIEERRAVKAERVEQALAMRKAGHTHAEIGEALDCSDCTVARWLRRAHQEAFQRMEDQAEAEMRTQIGEYRRVFREAMTGWKLSRQVSETVVVTSGLGGMAG